MKTIESKLVVLAIIFAFYQTTISAQEEELTTNIQEFTPSKLLKKGQWDIKFFNSVYTQTEQTNTRSESMTIPRQTFFTNTTEIFTGISENRRVNIGAVFQLRSNTLGGQGALEVFSFEDNGNDRRSGLTTIAPAIRIQPFKSLSTFSFTSAFIIPVFGDHPDTVDDDVDSFLDQQSFAWETKFFYDHTFGQNKWQVFTEVDFKYNFGEKSTEVNPQESNVSEHFANNSLFLPFSAFLSYFPSPKSTVFVNGQQAFLIDLGNDFAQNYTQLGLGGKYQLTDVLNIEASFGKFVRGNNFQGLGQTFSLGLRALF